MRLSKSPLSSFGPREFLTRHIRLFFLALGFLTRLAPGKPAAAADMSASVLYYPLVGGTLGLIQLLPFALGAFSAQPWVQAWLYVLFSAWLTRALHLDGLADLLDAAGSGKHGDDFHAVLKDSRMGAFGTTGLLLALAGYLVLAAACFSAQRFAPLLFAPLFGRCLPIVLARIAPAHSRAGLGALLSAAPQPRCLLFALAAALLGGWICLGFFPFLLCVLLTIPLLLLLSRLARREGGWNGDYLGCAIVGGELVALLSALV